MMGAEPPLTRLTIDEFLDRLASSVPTPGGGSVAALCAALAAGLGEMACGFTIGKEAFAAAETEVREINQRLQQAGRMLRRLVQEDADAYARLMEMFQLDRGDPARGDRIRQAAAIAAGVPFQTTVLSRRVQLDLLRLAPIANPRLRSDVDAALLLASASVQAAVANVRINLKYMREQDARRVESELTVLLSAQPAI